MYLYVSTLLFLAVFIFLHKSNKLKHKNHPPGPPSLPIIGHLHLLKKPLPRCLDKLSKRCGPVMSLKLGVLPVVVVSSPSAVEECFTKNDIVLANRPQLGPVPLSGFSQNIGFSQFGEHWRKLRRIATEAIFSNTRLKQLASVLKDENKRLLVKLYQRLDSENNLVKVDLKSISQDLIFDVVMGVVGKRFNDDKVKERRETQELIEQIVRYAGPDLGDVLPFFHRVTGGRYGKQVRVLFKRMDMLLQGLIDEVRLESYKDGTYDLEVSDTLIGHLLGLQKNHPDCYTDNVIKELVSDVLVAGMDAPAVTLEWAMSNLVNNPDVLEKVKMELDTQIGQNRLINEDDLSNLHYLHNVILETLRLNPPVPLLLPHLSSQDCNIGGYNVPSGTILFVNTWAVHRDPTIWDDPTCFKPDRFENGKFENHKYLPFGFGRRSCPGSTMGQRMVGLTVGTLIQCFEWKRVSENKVDMSEGDGITMPKVQPLEVLCKARDPMIKQVIDLK